MGASTLQLTQQLRQFIWYHLDNDLIDNALFLAGRLYAIDPRNPDSVHVLSLCHFRAGQHKSAYDHCRNWSQKREHLGCAYVFAQACLVLERYAEGIAALERTRALWESRTPSLKGDAQRRPAPDAAAFHCILGKLAHGNGDIKKAVDCYVAALKLNPFMWDAFERLCDTGAAIRPLNIFKEGHLPASFLHAFDIGYSPRPHVTTTVAQDVTVSNGVHPVQITVSNPCEPSHPLKANSETGLTLGEPNVASKSSLPQSDNASASTANLIETPPAPSRDDIALGANGVRGTSVSQMEPPNAPLRRSRMQASATETQSGADAAKLRSVAAKPRSKEGSGESTDSQDPPKTSLFPPRTSKRTISGNEANAKMQPSMDPTAPGQRRSVRLFKKAPPSSTITGPKEGEPDLKKVKATGTRGRNTATSTVGRIVSGNRKPLEHPHADGQKPNHHQQQQQPPPPTTATVNNAPAAPTKLAGVPEAHNIPQRPRLTHTADGSSAIPQLIHLLTPLAQAYHALTHHDPQQTVTHLSSLPVHHRDTPYVLALLGRAHHDLNAYNDAVHAFSRLRALEPSSAQHMEVYSTALWHLKSDSELAFLAHELIETQRLAPGSWCALGNAFSLQREHDNAIKCFRRATQLDAKSAYAWTLLGHEYFSAEDLEKALHAYRKAVGVDRRHYQGWYGLGRVYERSGRLDLAEKHYRVATRINPRNAVLLCCVGTVQDRKGAHAAALATYDEAVRLAPGSAMARFKRARGLLRLRRFEESKDEFERLRDMAPEEANVYFMLGRVYRCMGRRAEAVRCLSGALGLDPKAAPLIKEAMEALGEEDGDVETVDDDDPDPAGMEE